MTFESMIDAPAAAVAVTTPPPPPPTASLDQVLDNVENVESVESEETLVAKVLYGNDLRRTASVAKFAPLHEVCSKLFGLPLDATVLKYQDEDGDKITMSSDEELNEARKLANDKVLRVFVENKQAAPIPPPVIPPAPQDQGFGLYPGLNYAWHGGMRGGFGRRGGFGGRGFHHGFQTPPFQHPHHPHQPHPHPHPAPPHMGGHFFPPHSPFQGHQSPYQHPSPVQTSYEQQPQQCGSATVTATYSSARMSNHGVFSPADSPFPSSSSHCRAARAEASPYAHCLKERKHAMKQQVKFMKASCATEEDRQAFKQLKREMYREFRNEKKAYKDQFKSEKCDDKKDKKEKREKKKCDRKEKKDKKDKKDKKNKDKLVARHVADVTIPDNSELPADTPVTKTWRLRNAGSIAWPADSQLLFISRRGDDLNGPERVFVGAVEPSQEVEVSVTFVTPSEPGRYIGYYRMANAEGKFGQRVWVSFIVPSSSPSTPMTDASTEKSAVEQETVKEEEKTVGVEATKEGEQASAPLLDVNMD